MQIQDLGEDGFIQYLSKHFAARPPLVGIGDDCAVIPSEQGRAWLVTTDALVEGVHFLKEQIPPKDLGHKTVAVSVSDITAMGGEPKYAFFSIAMPKGADTGWLKEVVEGISQACHEWNLLLLGGDTVGSKRDLFLNLTLIGTADLHQIKYRHTAEEGDVLCVSGHLGNSGGGLQALREQAEKTKDIESLLHAHFHPEPRPDQGMWLGAQSGVHAMMDISDGFDCDLKRLLKSSQKGAVIETSQFPVSKELAHVCLEKGWDVLKLVMTGGEDYCLIVTVAADAWDAISRSFQEQFGVPLFALGRITGKPEEILYLKDGKSIETPYQNYDPYL